MEKRTIFQEMLKGVRGLIRYEWSIITRDYSRKSVNAGILNLKNKH